MFRRSLMMAIAGTILLAGCNHAPMVAGLPQSTVPLANSESAASANSESAASRKLESTLRSNLIKATQMTFNAADKNKDGLLSLQEIAFLRWDEATFDRLDGIKHDGFLTIKEFQPEIAITNKIRSTIASSGHNVRILDQNDDARLTMDEFLAGNRLHFSGNDLVPEPVLNFRQDSFRRHAGTDFQLDATEMARLIGDVMSQGYSWKLMG